MYLDYFSWGLYVLLTIMTLYIITYKKEFIREHRTEILFLFVGLLLYSQYSRYGDRLFTTNFSYDLKDIPMNYCRWSAILVVVYAFTKNKYVAQFLYFQAGFAFFSVIFPGGDFFMLTQNHRALGYIYDHYVIAMMPLFLIFIDGIKPSKKAMYVSIAYSLIIPFALLPYALASGHNAYYILDGVFIPLVFGNNQVVISIVYILGTLAYNFVMYKLSFFLIKKGAEERKEAMFKPLYPWVIMGSYLVIGLIVGSFFINNVPSFIEDNTDTHNKEAIKQLDEFANIFEGTIDGDVVFFIEIVEKYEELVIMDEDGNFLPVLSDKNVFYYQQDDSQTDHVIIILYKNKDLENEKVKAYSFGN